MYSNRRISVDGGADFETIFQHKMTSLKLLLIE